MPFVYDANMKNSYLAHRTKSIDASGIRKIFALAAQLKDPVDFSIGQPDFDVPEALKREAIKAIECGTNRYSLTSGDAVLRQKIAHTMRTELNWDDAGVLVTSGVSGGLLLAFMSLINPGDEVIIPDPYFVIYKHVVHLLGGKCVFVDSYPDFRLPLEGMRNSITDKTKLIIVNSPCNPTGMVYTGDELQSLANLARQHDLIVLSDEIYEKFCYDTDYVSMASLYEKTLLLRGFGKAYAMTGWRLGYAACHPILKPIIEEMIKIQQYTFVCAPAPFQQAAVAALDYDISSLVDAYKQKRDLLYSELAHSFDIARPEGAFYAFAPAPGSSGEAFVERAIKNNCLVIPGSVFSEKDSHFRISYATADSEIQRGGRILCGLCN
jgi:aspartate aminotransferase